MTAWILVHLTYPVQPGDDVLVHAGAGGVGLLLTQLATARGARVISTVSTERRSSSRETRRRRGAALLRRPAAEAGARGPADGVGVAVACDGVGKDTFDAGVDSCAAAACSCSSARRAGRCRRSTRSGSNNGTLYLTRPTLFHHIATRPELLATAGSVYAAVADGTLDVRIGHRYPLAEARAAHEGVQARRTTGKVVLTP